MIGGSGGDTLTVSGLVGNQTSNTWTITGSNQGSINNGFIFEGIENLTGGAQDDRFLFDALDTISGVIDGAGGIDTLDYSAFGASSLVTVQRETKSASRIGRFENIDVVRGGSSNNDLLVGRNINADWTLSGLNSGSILDAGAPVPFTFEGFENLTGGDNNDNFIVPVGGRLTGNLIGTITPGRVAADKLDLSSQTAALRVDVSARNAGNASRGTTNVVGFTSIENVTTGSGDDVFAMAHGAGLTGLTDSGPGARDLIDFRHGRHRST